MIQFIDALNANSWLGFLLNVTMKSLVIFAVAGVLAFLLRRKSAALRSLVWYMSILGCLMVSVFSLTLSPLEIGVLPGNPVGFETEVPLENNQPVAVTVPTVPRPLPTTAASSPHVISPPVAPEPETGDSGTFQSNGSRTAFMSLHWTNWVVLIWAAVALFLFARLVVGIGSVWRITARSDEFSGSIRDLRLGLRIASWRRPVSVRRSDAITAPLMWGFWRPVILLPADADSWGEDRLRAVLLHELAHIRRNDWESQFIAQMMCAVYWFNPLVWFATRRMRVEAERACDDYVLGAGYQSTDYAEHLVDIVRTAKMAGSVSRASVAIARSSKIEERIRMILAENLNRRPLTKVALVVGYCIVIFLAMQIGAVRLAEAVNREEALYREIQTVSTYRPEELLPKPGLLGPPSASEKMEKYGQNWEMALEFCEKFLEAYPNSQRGDAVWYEQLNYLFGLQRNGEFDAGAEAFLLRHPSSKYANRLRRLRVYRFMDDQKFDQALVELDKIDDPVMLPEVYERKADVYMKQQDFLKMAESDLLWADLILGKPAPKFSHVSVNGDQISLQSFRGNVVMLYYWSTGDRFTKSEIPILKHLNEIHRENPDFVLITVCTHSTEAELKRFIETYEVPGVNLLLEPEAVPYQFGIVPLLNYLPHYVLLDKTGTIRMTGNIYVRWYDLKFKHWITALLAEDTTGDSESIIPQRQQFLAEYYAIKNQTNDSIAEYKKLLAFTPNNLDIMLDMLYLKMFPSTDTELMDRAYNRVLELDQLMQLSPELSLNIEYFALEMAKLFAERGGWDKGKTWTLFQIAVARDRGAMVIDSARRDSELFAVLQDIPEFQKLLTETPQSGIDRD